MSTVCWLLVALGALGASDTLYYHEWRARLPALGKAAAPELRLHAERDFLYAFLFAALPWLSFRGALVVALLAAFAAEIVITLRDFVVEDRVRKPIGGVYPGERVMHGLMGIVYGCMIATLAPHLLTWSRLATGVWPHQPDVPLALRLALAAMAAGVFTSGVRDLLASLEVRGAAWPWTRAREAS